VAKSVAYDKLYQKLKTKEGEKEVFRLANIRERRVRHLGIICIKDENDKVLIEEAEIKERWESHFCKLFSRE